LYDEIGMDMEKLELFLLDRHIQRLKSTSMATLILAQKVDGLKSIRNLVD
jgi:hypothetical protein